ncbi:MAG TPA: WG repeat-containing protein [Cyclobacteriaceae bacterium]|nr:WG repeat-containing protein [Cyclobacteriaceae bacterium]
MIRSRLLLFLVIIISIFKSCSTIKRSDYEVKVRTYLDQFEKNLTSSDEVILRQFNVEKSSETVLKAIRVIQNKGLGKDSILVTVNFKNAAIVFEEVDIRVEITSHLKSIDPAFVLEEDVVFTLWLTSDDGDLTITKIDADPLYSGYWRAVHELANRKDREKALSSRKIFIDQANKLKETYDSVVWYARYKDSIYYYVANGKFESYFFKQDQQHPHTFTMGLVSETGRVIVPPTYDLIGTIGFEQPDIVEVITDGRVGHYRMDGEELVPSVYDWIIPYSEGDNMYALARQDTTEGWLDMSYSFHPGFPTETAQKYIREFQFGSNLSVSKETKTMAESLNFERMGFGTVIPPAHFVQSGIFKQVISYIHLGNSDMYYEGTEYVKTKGSLFERITENISALIVMVETRYLGGREEFYRYQNLTLMDNKGNPVFQDELYEGKNTFRLIDSTLLELETTALASVASEYWDMGDSPGDWNPPQFKYFRISPETNTLVALTSHRQYDCTEFVKLDSSYLTGEFVSWDNERKESRTNSFVTKETLIEMRNEILASYKYTFNDPKILENFEHREWYVMAYDDYDDFWDDMTEIDRHNLTFLESMIGTLRKKPI